MTVPNIDKLDALLERALDLARAPGAALAIVADGKTLFARGYGYRDLAAKLPMTAATIFPIASTSKAMNAVLLGMLVDEGRLAWDAPVQAYLPRFRLDDGCSGNHVTVRDLVTMRTGLPRHDWMWIANPISRADLQERLRHLDLSAGARERFQYSNLTVAISGHIAEVITGISWEELVRQRIFRPLNMSDTDCGMPTTGNVTQSYHETSRRELTLTTRLATELIAPAGGAIHSTVEDMARWLQFNLDAGRCDGRALIHPRTLEEIHSPQIVMGPDYAERRPNATYALGWAVDVHHGRVRLAHGGYLHDVDSEVTLLPRDGIGIVSFVNFGPPMISLAINRQVTDLLLGLESAPVLEEHLAGYERKIAATRADHSSLRRVPGTSPSHPLTEYAGTYVHEGYGPLQIGCRHNQLTLQRHALTLPLQHWHYDSWITLDIDLFPIHQPHAFDHASRLSFQTNVDGEIAAVAIRLEPAVAPIVFRKERSLSEVDS